MIFDTHCHLYDDKYENKDEVITACINQGVTLMMIPGDNIENSKKAVYLASKYQEIYAAVGIHPEEIDSIELKQGIEELRKLVSSSNKIKAIGEIGLDKHWIKDEVTISKQKEYFIEQINLANELHLPIIVHARDADGDTFDILRKYKPLYGCVLHCFSGSVELMKEYVKMGFYIGVDGPVTYKNSITPKEVAKEVPLENLVIETDSPYLPPVPHRGEINYPYYLKIILDKISELRGIVSREIEYTTYNNGKRLFRID